MAAGDDERVEQEFVDNDGLEQHEDVLDADQLEFVDEEGHLPWLETDDGLEEYESADTGRMIGFVLLGLVALAAIVGGIWWATHRTTDAALVADGSTVAAPDQPYKEAPKDPGGKTFDGTGDSSFAVSEGQVRPARLGQSDTAPKPTLGVDPSSPTGMGVGRPVATATAPAAKGAQAGPAPRPVAAPVASAPVAAAAAGTAVQVGAYSTQASADAAWARLSSSHSALSGVRHRVVEGKADIGTVFRLQALPGDAGAAAALCSRLKSSGLACQVK